MSIYLCLYLSIYVSTYLSINLSIYLSICQADVKTCQGDGKAETQSSEPNMSIYLSIYSETSATPEVARTCRQEQPIEDIGSTGRVNESSRLSVAKLKLNGVRNVYQTCQGDVKTCQGDGTAETEWSEPRMSVYLCLYLSIYVSTYRSINLSIYLSICQADVKTCQGDGKAETQSSEPNMSIYLSIYSETSATPEVARTCRQEQPIEDIGSTGRVNESSRLSVAKLKLNGVRNVYQTCQGDVKTCQGDVKACQGDSKAETEWSEPSMSI